MLNRAELFCCTAQTPMPATQWAVPRAPVTRDRALSFVGRACREFAPLVIALRTLENAGARCIVFGRRAMDPVGWIAAIIIGGIAGWLAQQFMKSDMGLLINIVLGVVGAAIASAILSAFGIALGGWLGYLIAGF